MNPNNKLRHQSVLIVGIILFFWIGSCTPCKTVSAPDLTEDELGWVWYKNMKPFYHVRYYEGNTWKEDTITIEFFYHGISRDFVSVEGCEDNLKYMIAKNNFSIVFPNGKRTFNCGVNICRINETNLGVCSGYSRPINNLDTAMINGRIFQQVVKFNTMSYTAYIAKGYGLIFWTNNSGTRASILPEK